MTYAWTCTGGSFSDPTSQTPTWTAPSNAAPGNTGTLTCTVTDGAGGSPLGTYEVGSRDDGSITSTVTVHYVAASGGTPTGTLTVTNPGGWMPDPAYVDDVTYGGVQAQLSPSYDSDGSGPTFVTYSYTTGGLWRSDDGTAGSFSTYSGNYVIGWAASDTSENRFNATFFDPGYYILQVNCSATIYDCSSGSPLTTITGTGYIGGDASDIGGGSSDDVRAMDGGTGGDGKLVQSVWSWTTTGWGDSSGGGSDDIVLGAGHSRDNAFDKVLGHETPIVYADDSPPTDDYSVMALFNVNLAYSLDTGSSATTSSDLSQSNAKSAYQTGIDGALSDWNYYSTFAQSFTEDLASDYESGAALQRIGCTFQGMGAAVVDTAKGLISIAQDPKGFITSTISGISATLVDPSKFTGAVSRAASDYVAKASTDPNGFANDTGVIAGNLMIAVAGTRASIKLGKLLKSSLLTTASESSTVWKLILPSAELYPQSLVPKYFSLAIGAERFSIIPNATEHVDELARSFISNAVAPGVPVPLEVNASCTKEAIDEMTNALADATRNGYTYGETIYDSTRTWEFTIRKPLQVPYDAVVHAFYRSSGFK